jgi:Tol biopolymer transport system component/tRNA A-37 threonylcarbamoyl transferase component Bud32
MTDVISRIGAAVSDRYRIERELGAGGMATVYLAEDVRHHRKVALKVLHPELSAVLGPERFLKEIELTASLQHPHILPLFDSGNAEGQLFYVMPFVEGETLRSRLERERQLPIGDALRIATEVADALQYAHERGVIHRDIKPENILLQGGHAVVADFGIALAVQHAGGQRMTQTGLSLGTPQYMSPEQAMGEKTMDARSDIYALGAVAYEMLVGEPPFTGPTAQAIVARVLSASPASVTASRGTVPAHVDRAILTALAKLPADRHASAREFASALAAPALGNGARPGMSDAVVAASPRVHPRRAGLAIAGAAIALVATAATGYVVGRSRASTDGPTLAFGRAAQVTWESGLEVMPAISPDGKQVAYAVGTSTRVRLYVRPVAGGRATAVTDDTTAVEIHPQWSRDGSRLLYISNGRVFSAPAGGGTARQEIPDRGGQVMSVAWSPDERQIAFTIADTVFVRGQDGSVRSLAQLPSAAGCAWSARDLLACTSGNPWYLTPGSIFNNRAPTAIAVIRVRDGTTRQISDSTSGNQVPQWSANGDWLYYLSDRDGMTDLYAQRIAADGAMLGALGRLTTGLNAHSFTVSGDGRRLAYARLAEQANIWSLPIEGAAVAAAEQVTSGQQVIESVNVSRDGSWLYYDSNLAGSSDLYRMRLPSGNPERLTRDSTNEFSPVPSPDGREVVFHSFRGGTRDLYSYPLDGGSIETVAATPLQEGLAQWSPDGHAIAFSDLQLGGGVHITSRGSDGRWAASRRLTTGSFAAWSPDGRQLTFADRLGGGSLVAIEASGGPTRTLFDGSRPGGPRALKSAWSDDGASVYFKLVNQAGNSEVWTVPSQGGAAHRLTKLGDARRRSDRFEFAVARGRMYFVLKELESDVWVIDVTPK